MKLFYYQHEGMQNFGDDLNPWLWERLLPPGLLDQDPTTTLVGIGTLLNENLPGWTPGARERWVFSTGVGYYNSPPTADKTYRFYCVRGPLSAKALGLSDEYAVADGALLLRRVYRETRQKRHRFAFMPHLDLLAEEGWRIACEEAGVAFIDPRWPTEKVLDILLASEVVFAEAMHGAIVADALRVPWVPIVTSERILHFKWEDWCQSVGLKYEPVRITGQVKPRETVDILTPLRAVRYTMLRRQATRDLKQLVQNHRPVLSADDVIERRTEQLEDRLARLIQDMQGAREANPSRELSLVR